MSYDEAAMDGFGLTLGDYARARDLLKRLFGVPVGEGRHRVVFREGDHVVKCPTSETGAMACGDEIDSSSPYLARSVRHPLSDYLGLPVVWQEWVEHTGCSEDPDWTWGVDSGQVGRTSDGRLVAYDWDHY